MDITTLLNVNDIVCVTETWLISPPQYCPPYNFSLITSQAVRTAERGRASGGLLIALNSQLNDIFTLINNDYPNLPLFFGGDFNARVGDLNQLREEMFPENAHITPFRSNLDKCINKRGEELVSCMEDNGCIILNGRSPGDYLGQYTYILNKGKSTIDLGWNRLNMNGGKLYTLFVDFSNAFPSVSHSLLWKKLYKMGMGYKITKILIDFYSKATVAVQNDGETSTPVKVTRGLLQGEKSSPILFSLFMADLEDFLRAEGIRGVSMGHKNEIILLAYADDIALFADSPAALNKLLRALLKYCIKNCLEEFRNIIPRLLKRP
ncbi:uncharacterized protein LOC122508659 [Leptopilina heterotoma]|uniref:uncharacterized protein LOC122508659 n=1 Tax=Leptopilina heterotoma TaxID=63436 RepID=UPI001CA901DF|nr:uncharacterized protein LOC122508659 [Leptopilina heterotoma]